MSFLFGSPKVAAPVAPPSQSAAEVQAAQLAERQRAAAAQGRESTILTPAGYQGGSTNIGSKTLLGQ